MSTYHSLIYTSEQYCLHKVEQLSQRFTPLDDVSRNQLKLPFIYYRPWGFANCPFGSHANIAYWIYVHINAPQFVEAYMSKSPYGSLEEYLDSINVYHEDALDIIATSCTNGFAWKSGAIHAPPVFYGDKVVLTQAERDTLGQYMGLVKFSEWME